MISTLVTMIVHAFRRTALPLGAYYGITLIVPLANGAAQSGSIFLEHALIVLIVPPTIIVCACLVRALAGALRSRSQRFIERGLSDFAKATADPP